MTIVRTWLARVLQLANHLIHIPQHPSHNFIFFALTLVAKQSHFSGYFAKVYKLHGTSCSLSLHFCRQRLGMDGRTDGCNCCRHLMRSSVHELEEGRKARGIFLFPSSDVAKLVIMCKKI
jgi:hypothetical protein